MKLHDPATEKELLRLAGIGRGGKPMEERDSSGGWVDRWLGQPLSLLFLFLPAMAMGAIDPRLRTEHWRMLIISILLLWAAQFGQATLAGRIYQQNDHVYFSNLPIRGEHIFCWVRSRFLWEKWLSVVAFGFVGAFAIHGFSLSTPGDLALTTLLLSGTTLATMMVFAEPWIRRMHLPAIWNVASLLLAAWLILLFFTDKKIFRIGEAPEWLAATILSFTWVLPPSWSLPGRLESGGWLLALSWIVWGTRRWISWPAASAPYFDEDRDFPLGFDDEEDDWEPEKSPDEAPVPVEIPSAPIRLPAPLGMPTTGWVERCIHHRLGAADAQLLGALGDPEMNWTKKTHRALITLTAWLCVVWVFTAFFPESNWKETITLWTWIVSVLLPIVMLLPATNALPRAMAQWIVGLQGFPFFVALPITARDLLRLSMRITTIRCTIMAVIATPYAWCLLAVLDPESDPRAALWMLPAFCCFWITSRPLFIWYRLQEKSYPRRGVRTANALTFVCNLGLCIAWLLSGVVGVVSGLGYFLDKPVEDDVWLLPLSAGIGLLASALCARAVFEIYHWRLARRHLDWLSSM